MAFFRNRNTYSHTNMTAICNHWGQKKSLSLTDCLDPLWPVTLGNEIQLLSYLHIFLLLHLPFILCLLPSMFIHLPFIFLSSYLYLSLCATTIIGEDGTQVNNIPSSSTNSVCEVFPFIFVIPLHLRWIVTSWGLSNTSIHPNLPKHILLSTLMKEETVPK